MNWWPIQGLYPPFNLCAEDRVHWELHGWDNGWWYDNLWGISCSLFIFGDALNIHERQIPKVKVSKQGSLLIMLKCILSGLDFYGLLDMWWRCDNWWLVFSDNGSFQVDDIFPFSFVCSPYSWNVPIVGQIKTNAILITGVDELLTILIC